MSQSIDEILKTLNPDQAEAVRWCGGPELVLAGAGSGKTRVLVTKIAYLVSVLGVAPHNILALTFTNKAAREMLERANKIVGSDLRGMQISTFHSYGLRFLFRNTNSLRAMGYPVPFVVFDRADSRNLVRRVMNELRIDTKTYDVAWMLDVLSKAKAGANPTTLEPAIPFKWRDVYERYQSELTRMGALDFDDLMILPLHLLKTDSGLREIERARVRWMLVDEYQDVNTPQYLLLRELAGDSGRLMVVGDPDQSIYGWRGADMSLILRFEDDFPGAKVVVLDRNYRSTRYILDGANAVISRNADRREKNLWSASEEDGRRIRLLLARNDIEEAAFIAGEIESLSDEGYEYGEMAILYRANSLSRLYEQTLLERGIPYRIIRGVAFYDRREIKDIISMLRCAVNPRDRAALERVAGVPQRGLGKKSVEILAEYLADAKGDAAGIWAGLAGSPPLKGKAAQGAREFAALMAGILCRQDDPHGMVEFILYNGGYEDYLREECANDWQDRLDNVRELLSILPEGDLAGILAEVALFTDNDLESDGISRVNLLTLHAAKGLEFPVVFMPGLEEGIFPNERAMQEGELEEERRLCYVGMTRAQVRLYISGAASRAMFGTFVRSRFSRFLSELPGRCVEIDDRANGALGGVSNVRSRTDGGRWRW